MVKKASLWRIGLGGLSVFAAAWLTPQPAPAQVSPFVAPPSAMDTLNQAPVGSAAGNLALDRARGLQGPPPGAPFGQPPAVPGQPGVPGLQTLTSLLQPIGPRITVLSGTRVFDAVYPHELLDDVQERQVPESEKNKYYDDGSHGDVEQGDGKYTRIDESKEYLSQSNQRIKEELVQALVSANDMNPLQFFGYRLMSTERAETVSHNRVWKLVPNPDGPGSMLTEVPINPADPVKVPKYREKQVDKDQRVKGDWADRFLQEFRKNKDDLNSEFYTLYVPTPPVPPAVMPPTGWRPFASATPPEVLNAATAEAAAAAAQGTAAPNNALAQPEALNYPTTGGGYYNTAR